MLFHSHEVCIDFTLSIKSFFKLLLALSQKLLYFSSNSSSLIKKDVYLASLKLFLHLLSYLKDLYIKFYNMSDNPKNNILMSENIKQKRLTILEHFDEYIYHHYQPKLIQ